MSRCDTKYCLNEARPGRKKCRKCESRKRRKKSPISEFYYNWKSKAKRRGIEFSISLGWFYKFCAETNYMKLKGPNGEHMTLDRDDETKGYIEGNIKMITRVANGKKYNENAKKGKTYKTYNTPKFGEIDPDTGVAMPF